MSSQNKPEAEVGDGNQQHGKRSNQKSPSDDLICPIMHDLPFDPVTAEDGRVYERSAILAHFRSNPTIIKSPITNEPMGHRLFPAIQTKNLIETLIENKTIQGDLAEAWLNKKDDKKKVEGLSKKANDGDTRAMLMLGKLYYNGYCTAAEVDIKERVVIKSCIVAFIWLKKAADNGVIEGLAYIGYMYMHGDGVTQNSTIGVAFTVMAAEGGSDMACCQLGLWFAEGRHGLNVKTTPAKHFLQKGTSGFCLYTHCNKALKV